MSMNDKPTLKLLKLVQMQAGISRRKARALIDAGEIDVNGETVCNPFLTITPGTLGELRLHGYPLSILPPQHRVYKYYKPVGVLCSHDDPHCGNTVGRVLRAEGFIGYTWAGRLDQDAEGLLLLTNDGKLVQRLSHPRYQVRKAYAVWLSHFPAAGKMEQVFLEMQHGITEDKEVLCIVKGELKRSPKRICITLAEGRKHEIKRLFSHFDLEIIRLKRVAIGPVSLGDLVTGKIACLDDEQVKNLCRFSDSLAFAEESGPANIYSL